jgi:hypothetical protein
VGTGLVDWQPVMEVQRRGKAGEAPRREGAATGKLRDW